MLKFFKIFILTLFLIFFKNTLAFSTDQKIIVGLLVPLSGDNKNLGELIVKSTRMALKEIDSNNLEIYPKDTASDPNKTLRSALELKKLGAKVIIGPVFFDNLIYLNEVDDVIFLSLTNKTSNLPKNIISGGVNSVSQLNAIKKFVESNEIKKTIFLTPDLDYKEEIKKRLINQKLKFTNIMFITLSQQN